LVKKLELYLITFDDYTKMKKIRMTICQIIEKLTCIRFSFIDMILKETVIPGVLINLAKNPTTTKKV